MKEKTFYKILIASIAFVLLITGVNLQVYASITEDTDTGSITVSGVETGVAVSIYRIVNVNYDYTADQPGTTPYEWNSSVATWLRSTSGEENDYSTYVDPEKFYDAVESMSANAAAFYSDLAAAIRGGDISLTATETKSVSGNAPSYPVTEEKLTGSVTFTDCEMGTYLVLIENGYMVYTPSAVNLTPKFNDEESVNEWELDDEVTVQIKATKPQVKKTVTNAELQADNYSTTQEIAYTLVADIPNYSPNSLATNYYLSDNLGDGLRLKADTVLVYGVKGTEEVELEDGYILTTSNAKRPNNLGDATLSLNFTYDSISQYDSIKVTYKASLDKSTSTVIGSAGNNNTAFLDYSNNPYNAASFQTQESSTVVYSYGIEITTIDKTTLGALPSAEYKLFDSEDNELYFVSTGEVGKYYLATENDTDAVTRLVSGTNGILYIYGLDTGKYTLKQTKAPNEYNSATDSPVIEIVDDGPDGALDDEDGTTTGMYKLSIPNSKAFILPVTGGIGTTIFVALGVVFVGFGLLLLILVIKKRKNEE